MSNFFSNFDATTCSLCSSKKFRTLLHFSGKVLLTNNSIIFSELKKIECTKCGLVRDGLSRQMNNLKKHYQENYEDHFSVNENSTFFTKDHSIDRSTYVANWISNILDNNVKKIRSIIEVGCGTGSLLTQLSSKYPNKKILGIETSPKAIEIGKKNDLDIRSMDTYSSNNKMDLVISYAVIEHTPNPSQFFKFLLSLINPDGYILLGQPHQNKLNPDIFYQDHLFHFSTTHIQEFARQNNLVQIKKSLGKGPLNNFSFHLFQKSKKNLQRKKIIFVKTQVKKSIQYYSHVFNNVNRLLSDLKPTSTLAIFGTSMFFHLFYTYTNLSKHKIHVAIDDFPSTKKFPFRIITSKELDTENIDHILLCLNPVYIKTVLRKLGQRKYDYLIPFDSM